MSPTPPTTPPTGLPPTPPTPPTSPPSASGPSAAQKTCDEEIELRVLSAKVDVLANGDSRVLWALGLCAALLASVTAYNWFTYDREKAALVQELRCQNDRALAAAMTNLNGLLTAEGDKIQRQAKQDHDDNIRRLRSIADTNIAFIAGIISNFNGEVASKISARDLQIGLLETNLFVIKHQVEGARAAADGALFLAEAQSFKGQKDYAAAAIRAMNAADSYYSVPDYLRISNCLQIVEEAGVQIDSKQLEQSGVKMRLARFYFKYSQMLTSDSSGYPQKELAHLRAVVFKVWGTNATTWIDASPPSEAPQIRKLGE